MPQTGDSSVAHPVRDAVPCAEDADVADPVGLAWLAFHRKLGDADRLKNLDTVAHGGASSLAQRLELV